ncbi:MAG: type II toxin-antitoxin system RelE/ParE family toxin [Devosia sp.]
MHRTRYLRSAERDFRELFVYIATESGDRAIARSVATRLRKQCTKLASLAGTLGRARPEIGADIRSFPYKGCVIFFRYTDDVLVVVDVLNARRDIVAYFDDDAPSDDG